MIFITGFFLKAVLCCLKESCRGRISDCRKEIGIQLRPERPDDFLQIVPLHERSDTVGSEESLLRYPMYGNAMRCGSTFNRVDQMSGAAPLLPHCILNDGRPGVEALYVSDYKPDGARFRCSGIGREAEAFRIPKDIIIEYRNAHSASFGFNRQQFRRHIHRVQLAQQGCYEKLRESCPA